MEPPSKKARTLWEEDSNESGDESGGVSLTKGSGTGFKINEDYARRFEYNKKREEVQKLESKYGKVPAVGKQRAGEASDDDSSSDEDEDDDGELVTEAVDAEIMATLKAIREKDPRVYDANATFYTQADEDAADAPKDKKERPITLRDYHRENLLNGIDVAEEEGKETIKTFAQEQAELKDALVKEMHAADADEEMEDADDTFLVRKAGGADVIPEKEVKLDIENADKDPETFLSNFMSARAWIPEGGRRELHPFESDDDEELERADAFEEAYNFRFEDPNKLNEKIMTHARDTTNSLSVRREEKSARKKIRDAERQRKEEEKKQRETEKNRLRKLKAEELQKKVAQIKEVAGFRAAEFTDEDWAHFLDEAWDDNEWEKEMQKRFGQEYYEEPEGESKKHPKKPTWDDDIDIKDLVPDYDDEEELAHPAVDSGDEDEVNEEDGEASASGPKKKSKAELKREQKRDARKEKMRIEEAIDRNLDLDITLLPGATKKNSTRFRYRETSPQSFGLTARDILMADDQQLNQFAGLKKLASFRDPEKKAKDERKLGKKARLRQWRKDTFGSEEGPTIELSAHQPSHDSEKHADHDEAKVDIREGDGSGRKKRKRSKKH
ncbi:Uncharacterized protein PECH_004217 [Penicillium ucsense]|uniref:Kri1-like C-terminal domain-containing protein n=1 Tax=Penicillium ucsense TaxID=2839758 RepID=A0A8J8VWK9_9EURO|nr:Uncharacterized protein PECM_003771 [Penicillium ucsense]KAF7727516.1 Uncharacterized protein PECH_004217 [Penicillium ucsense]